MEGVRTTVVFEPGVLARIRQMSKRNISATVNKLLREHLSERQKKLKSLFGAFKGHGLLEELFKMRKEERERDAAKFGR